VWISEQTAIISLYNINWLVCITETECLLRGTDCVKWRGKPVFDPWSVWFGVYKDTLGQFPHQHIGIPCQYNSASAQHSSSS